MSRGGSICIVMPAYDEAENLPPVVDAARRYLTARGADYRIVVVDDGSRDGTAEVAARLAAADPDRLQVVRHPVNRGYGAAVRSGLAAAVATPCEWVLLTDSDGQFDIADLGTLLDVAAWERADLVAGHRVRRADPAIRRLNAWLWGSACRLLLGFEVRDVDCAFKLIHRRVLESVSLEGEAAVISPELLAKADRAGFRIVEVPVHHYPRRAGEQTGARPAVVARSLIGLVRLARRIRARPRRGGQGRLTRAASR